MSEIMPDKRFTEVIDGEQVVRTIAVEGDIIPEPAKDPSKYFTALIDTANGPQQAVKTYNVGGGITPTLNKVIIKDAVIPTASADNAGYMYIYDGQTNSTYTHGYIYENQYVPNYSGTITFSPAGISVSDENFSSFLNTWKQYLNTPTLVTNGTITYFADSDLWRMVMKDANNQQIGVLQLYQQDYEDSGFTFPANPQDGDEYTFTTTITESSSSYQWVRIDVQPGGGTVKFVPELPSQGEERYIYGVVLEETTREGYGIIQLFMWYNDNWYAAGAFDVDISPNGIVYEQSFDTTTNTWTVKVG